MELLQKALSDKNVRSSGAALCVLQYIESLPNQEFDGKQAEIASKLNITRVYLVEVIKRLEKHGYLKKVRSTGGKVTGLKLRKESHV